MNKTWSIARLCGVGAAVGVTTMLTYLSSAFAVVDGLGSHPAAEAVPARVEALCLPPEPSAIASVVILKGYEGGTLSSTTVAGQDAATEVTRVTIEEGDGPIYVLANSYVPMVWQLDGAVDRLERFVAQSRKSYAGVVGLPPERVAITDTRVCDELGDRQEVFVEGRRLGMRLLTNAKFVESYTLGHVSLPSGRITEPRIEREDIGDLRRLAQRGDTTAPPRPVSRFILDDLLRFSPGGVLNVDPEMVMSNGPAQRYVVLPQEAGLVQLIQEGKLERLQRGFAVREPIDRFPAGLDGAHSVRFILPDDLPMPKGHLKHSSVVRQGELERQDEERRARIQRLREERRSEKAN